MSIARSRGQEWWADDEAPTQAIPIGAVRGARPAGSRPVPLRAAERSSQATARVATAPRSAPGATFPDLSKVVTTTLIIGALALLLYLGITSLIAWTHVKLDDMHYGRPRTSQIDAFVGHNESGGTPTHFVAMNLNRRVTILEFPGGDVTKPQVIAGPYLFGRAEDLTVVTLRAVDVNGDNKPDLMVQVKDERLVYINDGAGFRPITPEELAQLKDKEGSR